MNIYVNLRRAGLRIAGASLLTGAIMVSGGCAFFQGSQADTRSGGAIPSQTRHALSLDTPVSRIVAYPGGKAVLDQDLPGLTTHPEYPLFKSMSVRSLAAQSNGKITPAEMQRVGRDLAALSASGTAPAPAR